MKSRKMRTWGRGVSCQFGHPFLRCLIWQFQVLAYMILGQRGAAEAFKSFLHKMSFLLHFQFSCMPLTCVATGDKNCQVTCIHTLVLIQRGEGVRLIKDVRDGRGVKGKADKCGKGEGGGPKSRKFCGRPLCMVPLLYDLHSEVAT